MKSARALNASGIGREAHEVAVHAVRVRPVSLGRHDGEAVLADQASRDAGALPVELVRPVRRLADHHDPPRPDLVEQLVVVSPRPGHRVEHLGAAARARKGRHGRTPRRVTSDVDRLPRALMPPGWTSLASATGGPPPSSSRPSSSLDFLRFRPGGFDPGRLALQALDLALHRRDLALHLSVDRTEHAIGRRGAAVDEVLDAHVELAGPTLGCRVTRRDVLPSCRAAPPSSPDRRPWTGSEGCLPPALAVALALVLFVVRPCSWMAPLIGLRKDCVTDLCAVGSGQAPVRPGRPSAPHVCAAGMRRRAAGPARDSMTRARVRCCRRGGGPIHGSRRPARRSRRRPPGP